MLLFFPKSLHHHCVELSSGVSRNSPQCAKENQCKKLVTSISTKNYTFNKQTKVKECENTILWNLVGQTHSLPQKQSRPVVTSFCQHFCDEEIFGKKNDRSPR
jgi:hypothetical protein